MRKKHRGEMQRREIRGDQTGREKYMRGNQETEKTDKNANDGLDNIGK
jgi:hypothetical protein